MEKCAICYRLSAYNLCPDCVTYLKRCVSETEIRLRERYTMEIGEMEDLKRNKKLLEKYNRMTRVI